MKKILLITFSLFFIQLHSQAQFIHREGTKLIQHEKEIHLRGMSFGNLVWVDREIPSAHHNEKDYQRLADLGMNAIRFYLNYKTFEDDNSPYSYKQSGWDWIDQNIAWAKKHGIYLILNMHVPQGGFQSQCEGEALWDVTSNQDRLVALWTAIADKYSNEPQIAAFDILNEPTPKDSVEQWFQLCKRIVDAIRLVDDHHLLITERAIAVGCDYGFNNGNYNYPPLEEENLMYTVHMYEPFAFTHQNLEWTGNGDGGAYPDTTILSPPSDLTFATGQYSNPKLPSGTTDWTYLKGKPFYVNNDSLILGRTVLYGHALGEGKAYYDNITVNEVTAAGTVIRELFKLPLSEQIAVSPWSENGDGEDGFANEGQNDDFSLTKTGTSGYGTTTLTGYSFKAEKGKYYATSGWAKGENIPSGSNTNVGFTNEFYYSPSGSKVTVRDYNYLLTTILDYTTYIEDRGFPVYFGEFGVARNTFENSKGGEKWVRDVLSIFDSLGYHFTYHTYREPSFGYYETWDGPLDTTTVNVLLKEVFLNYFNDVEVALDPSVRAEVELHVYPVPFKEYILVEDERVDSYLLTNVSGFVIKSGKQSKIPTSDLSPGQYLLILNDAKGKTLGIKKLVK